MFKTLFFAKGQKKFSFFLADIYIMPKRLYPSLVKRIKSEHRNHLEEKMVNSGAHEMKKICEDLEHRYHVTGKDLMGLGTSCIALKYGRDEVIKVCSKHIKYFHCSKTTSARDFQKNMKPLQPELLPMKDIIYDGKDFFVYVQDRCQPLSKKSKISRRDFADIIGIIQAIFSQGLLVGQLKPKNLGYWSSQGERRQLVLFDYHSMHNLHDRMKSKTQWWHSLDKSLEYYCRSFSKGKTSSLEKFRQYIRTVKSKDYDREKVNHLLDKAQEEVLSH